VYLRLDAREGINGQLTLLTHQAYIDRLASLMATIWLVIGIQLLRVFYNIILARYIRNTSFRWYVFHTVIVTMSVLGSFGVTGTWLGAWPSVSSFFNHGFYLLMPATYSLFIYSLLSVRVNYPGLRWAFFALIGYSVAQPFLTLVVPPSSVFMVNNYLFVSTGIFLTLLCLHALFRRVAMMLTAKVALENRLEGLDTGADDYLTKPFVKAELLLRVQNLLTRQQALRAFYQQQFRPVQAVGAVTPPPSRR